MGAGVRTRLRLVFPHGYMGGREKFGFRIWRNRDAARAGLGALACRRMGKAAYRRHRNHAVVYLAYGCAPGDAESNLILSNNKGSENGTV
jgi:hypothetical protein